MDFISKQKQWEAEQARIAAEATAPTEDDEMDSMTSTGAKSGILFMVNSLPVNADCEIDSEVMEKVLSEEDQELEALVSLMEAEGPDSKQHVKSPTEYGSDGEEYDDLFMEVLNASNVGPHNDGAEYQSEPDQDMDTSNG